MVAVLAVLLYVLVVWLLLSAFHYAQTRHKRELKEGSDPSMFSSSPTHRALP